MYGNFSFDGETINDGDFNNFYSEFMNMTEGGDNKPSATQPPASTQTKTTTKQKGGFFKGLGDFIKSDTGKAILTGVSQGIENNQGRTTDGTFEGAPDKKRDDEKPPMSTGAIIGISIGALAVVGAVIYFVTKK